MWRKVTIALVLAGLCALVLLVVVQRGANRHKAEVSAEILRHNAEAMRQQTARAQSCIDGIARRDPAADAAHDVARGDPTPIGIGYQAHDPPSIATDYPGARACAGYTSSSSYEPTGKWMRHTDFGFSHWPAPNQRRCEDAARRYATAYNERLSALAPDAVERFCRSRMDERRRLRAARLRR